MIRSLPARNFNQYWVGGDEAVNITGAAKQQAPPPAVLNTASVAIAEAISIQQITARCESAHHLVASSTNIPPPP